MHEDDVVYFSRWIFVLAVITVTSYLLAEAFLERNEKITLTNYPPFISHSARTLYQKLVVTDLSLQLPVQQIRLYSPQRYD